MAYQQQPQARYGHCDSYFVESHDDGIYAMRAEARERQRAISRMQQRALAEELSRLTADEYQEDIMQHMLHMESQTIPDVNSIDIQTEIQWFMRPYLLDFLVEAHAAFQLLPETLFLAVNLLDRYCSRRVVYKRHYQLVGCAALLIAAKYGDKKDRVPTVRELKSMCCSLYDDEMFTQMEWHVLQTLNWVIGHTSVDAFLQIALAEAPYDAEVEHMTLYIAEIALFHKEFVSTRPSVMARSALALARCVLSRPQARNSDWAGSYDPQTVIGLSNHLYQPSPVLARKYASLHLSNVSAIVDEFLQRQAQMARRTAAPPTQPPPPPPSTPSKAAPSKSMFSKTTPIKEKTPPKASSSKPPVSKSSSSKSTPSKPVSSKPGHSKSTPSKPTPSKTKSTPAKPTPLKIAPPKFTRSKSAISTSSSSSDDDAPELSPGDQQVVDLRTAILKQASSVTGLQGRSLTLNLKKTSSNEWYAALKDTGSDKYLKMWMNRKDTYDTQIEALEAYLRFVTKRKESMQLFPMSPKSGTKSK